MADQKEHMAQHQSKIGYDDDLHDLNHLGTPKVARASREHTAEHEHHDLGAVDGPTVERDIELVQDLHSDDAVPARESRSFPGSSVPRLDNPTVIEDILTGMENLVKRFADFLAALETNILKLLGVTKENQAPESHSTDAGQKKKFDRTRRKERRRKIDPGN